MSWNPFKRRREIRPEPAPTNITTDGAVLIPDVAAFDASDEDPRLDLGDGRSVSLRAFLDFHDRAATDPTATLTVQTEGDHR